MFSPSAPIPSYSIEYVWHHRKWVLVSSIVCYECERYRQYNLNYILDVYYVIFKSKYPLAFSDLHEFVCMNHRKLNILSSVPIISLGKSATDGMKNHDGGYQPGNHGQDQGRRVANGMVFKGWRSWPVPKLVHVSCRNHIAAKAGHFPALSGVFVELVAPGKLLNTVDVVPPPNDQLSKHKKATTRETQ